MRKSIGVLLIEQDGSEDVSVQLFENPEKSIRGFENMKGRPGDDKSRVAYLIVDYESADVRMMVKNLPGKPVFSSGAYQLGKGPIDVEENSKD